MQKYRDVVLNARGMPVVGALVLVNNYPSGIAASLFSSNNANPIGSQLSTDANGQFAFYAADGRYSLTISGISITTQTINDILLQDPATDISFPGGATLVGTTPTATLVSTNVQTSLAELDAKKIPFTTLALATGAALSGFNKPGIYQTVQNQLDMLYFGIANIKDTQFSGGAKGDGVTNDDAPINAWLALAGTGIFLYAPEGNYLFNTAKNIASLNKIRIHGDGRQLTQFFYNGANLTNDIFTIGDGTNAITDLYLDGFNIDSKVTMTAGTALRIRKSQNGGTVKNVSFGKLNTTKYLWDGIWFDNTNVNYYIGFEINVQNEAIPISGALTPTGSDLLIDEGTITYANYGIHVAGGFGGLYVGAVNIYGSKVTGYLQDNSRVAAANREILLSSQCVIDGSNSYNINVNETVGTNAILNCNAFVTGAGFFTATVGDGIYIQSMPVGRVSIGSGQIKANKRHGVNVADNTTNVLISPQTFITDNLGWGLFSSISLTLVKSYATYLYNTSGDINGNIRDYLSYSMTIGSGSGTLTSANGSMRYRRFGSTIQFNASINIVTNGSGATSITFTLPFTAKDNAIFNGKATAISNKSLGVVVLANVSLVTITNYDNTYPAASGETFIISGAYEAY